MTVFLPADQKGTHMSRFVALMEQQTEALDFDRLHKLTAEMVALLNSHSGKISVSFPFFRKKSAPISGIQSLLDYDVTLTGEIKNGAYSHNLKVMVPVTSLCPCSKEISQYGAHNQRSHVTVSLTANAEVGIEEIIDCVEAQASCQLYGLLKRPDEKYVTEKAYENPKFVDEMVRDDRVVLQVLAQGLRCEPREDLTTAPDEGPRPSHHIGRSQLQLVPRRSRERVAGRPLEPGRNPARRHPQQILGSPVPAALFPPARRGAWSRHRFCGQ